MNSEDKALVRTHIAPLLQNGELSLFLGAGATIGTPTINGMGVPSTAQLIERICNAAGLTAEDCDGADLPTAFGVGQDAIDNFENFLVGNFTISKPLRWQLEIFKHWWRAIFTTNIDTLAYKCIDANNEIAKGLPGYKVFNYLDREPISPLPTEPPVVHLHGNVIAPEDGFVFDSVSYADVTVKVSDWISRSALHIAHGQCVFVGSKFKESDIEAAIRQRSLWDRSLKSGASKNWVVLRKFTSLERRHYENRGIIPIEATAQEFFEFLFSNVSYVSPTKFIKRKAPYINISSANPSVAWFSSNIENVGSAISDAKARTGPLSRFYYGDMPDWFYVANDVPAHFSSIKKVTEAILAVENGDERGALISVTGPLASGKTTSCMMALAELAKTHNNIYAFSGQNALETEHTWRVLKDMKGLVVIFVDAASPFFYAINALIQRTLDTPTSCKICFLCEERTLAFRRNAHHLGQVPRKSITHVAIENLNIGDALALYEKSLSLGVSYEKLSDLSVKEAAQKIVDYENGYKGDLLATLYDLSSTQSYRERLKEEFSEISKERSVRAYQLVSIVTASKLAIPINYLAESLGLTINALLKLMDEDLGGKIHVNPKVMAVSARHHSIAEYHIGYLFSKELIKNNILALMRCVSSKFKIEDIKHHPISYKIYRQTLSNYFLTQVVFPGKANFPHIDEIYNECQKYFAHDGVFWLQYGRFLERKGGMADLSDALHCFRKGLGLYDSFQIRHALGQVLIKKFRLTASGDLDDFREGVDILQREIDERGSHDSYPYTALGNELLRLVKTGKEKDECLSILRDIINRGLEFHKGDEVFMNMVKDYFNVSGQPQVI